MALAELTKTVMGVRFQMAYYRTIAIYLIQWIRSYIKSWKSNLPVPVPLANKRDRDREATYLHPFVQYTNISSDHRHSSQLLTMLMTIDGTPDYHINADIPAGVKEYFPHAKIILTTREDISRLVSNFQFFKLGGYGTRVALPNMPYLKISLGLLRC